jgi:hypothetical protein
MTLIEPTDFMVFNRGSIDDWNYYSSVTGDSGWSCVDFI